MTASFKLIQWNKHKMVYDLVVLLVIVIAVAGFTVLQQASAEPNDPMVTLIRATGLTAAALLHLILLIGPICRLTPRALPILYNRRHLGVLTCMVAIAHAALVVVWYGAFGVRNPIESLFGYTALPFEFFGFISLVIMILLASTSHDFFNANLGPKLWKSLHMLVYVAYVSLIAHIVLGILQDETSPVLRVTVVVSVVVVVAMHLVAGMRSTRLSENTAQGSWLDAGAIEEFHPDRARLVQPSSGPGIAVFQHDDTYSAISNVCAHQGGPLSEGKVIDGCVTCPWHGYQYRPEDGCSPPPYTERIETYDVRIVAGRVQVREEANELGTKTELSEDSDSNSGGGPA